MADWHNTKQWVNARTYAKSVLDPYCAFCSKYLEGSDWTIDHIQPAGATGIPDHDISNLQSLCRQCNGRKQDRLLLRSTWRNPKWK
jgi:5-methylcytosine-specific restriction endonuclease McrA